MKWKCRTCGMEFVARRSKNKSAHANMLQATKNHYKKYHPNTIGRRISASLKARDDNPSIQDMVSALQSGTRSALNVYKKYTEAQYQHMKRVMDALEPVLPLELLVSWKALEAIHDYERDK